MSMQENLHLRLPECKLQNFAVQICISTHRRCIFASRAPTANRRFLSPPLLPTTSHLPPHRHRCVPAHHARRNRLVPDLAPPLPSVPVPTSSTVGCRSPPQISGFFFSSPRRRFDPDAARFAPRSFVGPNSSLPHAVFPPLPMPSPTSCYPIRPHRLPAAPPRCRTAPPRRRNLRRTIPSPQPPPPRPDSSPHGPAPPRKALKSKTGFFGVWAKPSGNFKVEFSDTGRRFWLGTYPTVHEAALAYDVAVWRVGRPRNDLNFPEIETQADAELLVPGGIRMVEITAKKTKKRPTIDIRSAIATRR
nr:leucine-rich repeat extensin-like protein 5 [Aegilops tauschii subsp. strangulata]